jgi:hypothetical protein
VVTGYVQGNCGYWLCAGNSNNIKISGLNINFVGDSGLGPLPRIPPLEAVRVVEF